MNICVVIGSRADKGLLAWPLKLLQDDVFFEVTVHDIAGVETAGEALTLLTDNFAEQRPDWLLILGDRFEIMAAALAAHLQRIPIAHIAGGDITEGSYDDAMRDCISRLASLHFVTNQLAYQRLLAMGYAQVYLVGSPGIDYIRHAEWKRARSYAEPYVVVSYQSETIDDTVDLAAVEQAIAGRRAIWIKPNSDRGNERIPGTIDYPHDEFLNLLYHCEEFIGNSSAIFYEAPELGVKTRLIGKRQRGRVTPWGDGHASERIMQFLKEQAVYV